MSTSLLDNPVWSSLAGPQAPFAERCQRAMRYPAEVSPFCALPDDPDEQDWWDLAQLVSPGTLVPLFRRDIQPPAGWEVVNRTDCVQLVGENVEPAEDPEVVRLGPADVPDMLALVGHAKPGPFLPRTVELGTYLGIRRNGALIAMAGERMRPPGWTEISAVCTDAAYRGQGLASRLTRAVAAGILARGDIPFLHAAAGNTKAIRLYESLGFRLRRRMVVSGNQVPPRPASGVRHDEVCRQPA